MAITLVASTTVSSGSAASYVLTVPAGVSLSHLGLILITTASSGGVAGWTIPDWTSRLENPTGQGASEVGVFTRLGGLVAGNAVTITSQTPRITSITGIWLNTQGRDVSVVGTPGTRSATASTTTLPGVSTATAGQDVLVIATERGTSTATTITGWSPSTPTQAFFQEFANTSSSHYVGSFVQSTAGLTSNYTVTYSTSAANAAAVLMSVSQPSTGWIKDPNASGGKRPFVRHRNPRANENVDGGSFGETDWAGDYDGGVPSTVDFFNSPINGGGVSG